MKLLKVFEHASCFPNLIPTWTSKTSGHKPKKIDRRD